jgi:nitrate/nitrite transporter NarK
MVAGLALSAFFLAAFGIQQRSRDNPILDPGIFVQPAMIEIAILLCAVSIGYWAILVYLPLFFAAAFDWSPEVAGIALLTATLPMLFLPPLGGRLVDRLGWRLHFALALVILAAGNATIAIALIDGSAPPLIRLLGIAPGSASLGSPATAARRVVCAGGPCGPGIGRHSVGARPASRSASCSSARCF